MISNLVIRKFIPTITISTLPLESQLYNQEEKALQLERSNSIIRKFILVISRLTLPSKS